jgi:transposase
MTDEQTDHLLKCFVEGTPARPAADTAGVNRNTARLYYHRLRVTLADRLDSVNRWFVEFCADPAPNSNAAAATPPPDTLRVVTLAGLIECDGRIHVVPIDGSSGAEPAAAASNVQDFDAVVCSDETVSATAPDETRKGRLHVVVRNSVASDPPRRRVIKSFWSKSARLLRRFKGVPRQNLFLYLKECEWRFNDGTNEARMDTLRACFVQSDRRSGIDRRTRR